MGFSLTIPLKRILISLRKIREKQAFGPKAGNCSTIISMVRILSMLSVVIIR